MHPDGLQAGGVTTDQVQGQSRGEHLVAIVEGDPVTVDLNHERPHQFGGEPVAQCHAEVGHGYGHIVAVSADEVLGPPGRSPYLTA